MSGCPMRPFLDFERFREGTPRAQLNLLREQHRILKEEDDYSTGFHWLVFRRDDIDHVLQNPQLFSNHYGVFIEDMPAAVLEEKQKSMTFMDPPLHRRHRVLVEGAFRPQALKAREPAMRAAATSILAPVLAKGSCEFVTEVAAKLPMAVMFTLMGVNPADEAYVVDTTNAVTMADDPDFAKNRRAGYDASVALVEFGEALAADHRRNPRDTMTQEVLQAELNGERLSDREFGRFFSNLIVGGLETTRNTLSWAMWEFIHHPDQYRALQADPSLVAGAVEESLRHRNTVVYLRRTAVAETEIAGEKIRPGDKVVCVLGGPNRDPATFERPDAFDITRPPEYTRRNIRTFGGGPHFCLGMHQARLNLTVMMEEIARSIDRPRLNGEPKHARSLFMDGLKALPIAFDRR